jgi:hypothetical protein
MVEVAAAAPGADGLAELVGVSPALDFEGSGPTASGTTAGDGTSSLDDEVAN